MKHPPMDKRTEGSIIAREHLVRLLLEQIERTFTAEGQEQGLLVVANLLRQLDEPALRGMVYQQGLEAEYELFEGEPEAPRESPTPE